jgi:hypothetical protein
VSLGSNRVPLPGSGGGILCDSINGGLGIAPSNRGELQPARTRPVHGGSCLASNQSRVRRQAPVHSL